MRILVIFLFLSVQLVFAQTKNKGKDLPGQWKYLAYNKVIAYKTKPIEYLVRGQVLVDSVVLRKVELTPLQISEIKSFLYNTNTYGTIPKTIKGGLCCNDYHFVFYNEKKIVAFITFQFDSNTLLTNYKIPARSETLVKAPGNVNYYIEGEGFSNEGKEKILQFMTKIGLSSAN